MYIEEIKSLFLKHRETNLFHRYITNKHIEPLLNNLGEYVVIETIGESVLNNPIYGLKIGTGNKRILMWSQMHGNESTTTKGLFDLLNTFLDKNVYSENILDTCTLYIIPILNPDGAEAYTRINANRVDLNRDAQNLSQPESKVLRRVFESFKPHFCYNLHGQRTIFGAGNTNKSATVSFLAPAQDEACTITPNRKIAMEVIGVMNETLQKIIPNQVGVYDDAFNLNCVGDTFQNENIPTILFEAGHYEDDYEREITRELIYISYISSLNYIANNSIMGNNYESYFKIPENEKCFHDVIIRNARVAVSHSNEKINDIAIQYQEKLIHDKIEFIPKIEKIEKLDDFYGHKEIDANGLKVFDINNQLVNINYENDFVIINNDKIALLSK
ncbi:M14 metallopeptidase family protein [Flavivirga spongiicola]|uniref:M14 family metallopeptidase n=1 Tax=Flavivirga spongiicola TaxID=421621 RepID=A0ABU7XXE5_9FLAO|nr:M14 metallopeptidase family protein [Flavivirga sp. MEBiC05379]MDO5980454.1 M14 family metallopeptidase [Flavivirga sp. MEBiC05379]